MNLSNSLLRLTPNALTLAILWVFLVVQAPTGSGHQLQVTHSGEHRGHTYPRSGKRTHGFTRNTSCQPGNRGHGSPCVHHCVHFRLHHRGTLAGAHHKQQAIQRNQQEAEHTGREDPLAYGFLPISFEKLASRQYEMPEDLSAAVADEEGVVTGAIPEAICT